MAVMVEELYTALRRIPGVTEEEARAAARAVLSVEHGGQLVTRADLAELAGSTRANLAELAGSTKAEFAIVRGDLAEMESRVIKWNVGAMALLTVIYGAINVLVRVL